MSIVSTDKLKSSDPMTPATIIGDVKGGLSAAIVALPTGISCGLLAFAPLGPEFIAQGVMAGLYAGVFATVVASLFGGTPFQISGPRSSLAVLLAAFLAHLMQSPDLPHDPLLRANTVFTLAFLTVMAAGVFQVLLGLLRLGDLVKYIPISVVAGLMNGFAIIIVINQAPVFLGVSGESGTANLTVGAVTVAVMLGTQRFVKALPAALVGIVAGTLAYHLIGEAAGAAATIGALPTRIPFPTQVADVFALFAGSVDLLPLLPDLLGAAFTLALLGSVMSLLSAVAGDGISDTRHRSNRELVGQGLGNLVSACFGGLAGGGSVTRVVTNYRSGGRTRRASLVHGLFFLAAVTVVGPAIGMIPVAAIAGVLLVFAVRMIDRRTIRLIGDLLSSRRTSPVGETLADLSVVVLVTVITVAVDFVVATGVGLVVASLRFSARTGRTVVLARYQGDRMRSKTARSREASAILDEEGKSTVVFEAQGPIFFGSADRLRSEIEGSLEESRFVVLDVRRVTEIDQTGIEVLRQIERTLTSRGKAFFLSNLSEDRALWKSIARLLGETAFAAEIVFADNDSALTEAENRILEERVGTVEARRELDLADMDVLRGMEPDELRHLEGILARQTYDPGARIVVAGERADALFFLASGTVSVKVRVPGSGRAARVAGFNPGVVFGEMVLSDEGRRTADVYADCDVVCYVLDRQDLMRLSAERADIVFTLLLNVSRELAARLRISNAQIAELEK